MKNILPFILMALGILSCSKKEDKMGFSVLSGKLENIDTDSIYVFNDEFRKAIPVTNSEFSDTLNFKDAQYFTLKMGNESTQIFLTPTDSLHVTVNGNEFDESLKYTGSSAEENNFLAADYLRDEVAMEHPEEIYTLEPNAYKAKMAELKNESNNALEKTQASAIFKEYQKKNNEAKYLSMLFQYPQAYQYFAGKSINLPVDFMKELDSYDLENEKDFVIIPNYRDLVLMKISEKFSEAANMEDMDKIVSEVKSQKIKDELMKSMLYEISSTNPDSKSIYDLILKHSKNEKVVKNTQEKYNAIQAILPGKPSPKFDYPDINGQNVKLDDLKGKLVYVDVWATWCGPCIQEIPSLKKLEGDFHGKNVEFVSISIDVKKDFEKWKKMVNEKELKGIQLFADNDWKSTFVKSYAIDGIPRFILIDKAGNIIDSDAPRPSDPQIRELIKANL
jgi:thiol-disulfide isomerase/thioredoxin